MVGEQDSWWNSTTNIWREEKLIDDKENPVDLLKKVEKKQTFIMTQLVNYLGEQKGYLCYLVFIEPGIKWAQLHAKWNEMEKYKSKSTGKGSKFHTALTELEYSRILQFKPAKKGKSFAEVYPTFSLYFLIRALNNEDLETYENLTAHLDLVLFTMRGKTRLEDRIFLIYMNDDEKKCKIKYIRKLWVPLPIRPDFVLKKDENFVIEDLKRKIIEYAGTDFTASEIRSDIEQPLVFPKYEKSMFLAKLVVFETTNPKLQKKMEKFFNNMTKMEEICPPYAVPTDSKSFTYKEILENSTEFYPRLIFYVSWQLQKYYKSIFERELQAENNAKATIEEIGYDEHRNKKIVALTKMQKCKEIAIQILGEKYYDKIIDENNLEK